MNSVFLRDEQLLLWVQEGPCLVMVRIRLRKYLNIPLQFLQEVLFTLLSHMQLLSFVEEVIVFECWQVLGLESNSSIELGRLIHLPMENELFRWEQCVQREGSLAQDAQFAPPAAQEPTGPGFG